MASTAQLIADGDAAFVRVDNRRAPHTLQPGEVARAVNCRFEQGQTRPRSGVAMEAWGVAGRNLVSGNWIGFGAPGGVTRCVVNGFVVGQDYFYLPNESTFMSTVPQDPDAGGSMPPAEYQITGPLKFTATQTTYYLWVTDNTYYTQPVNAMIVKLGRQLAYARFNNPADADLGVLLTDDWRDGAGEDGGRGRAWRIQANNVPLEIPLNGYDLWDTCRLTQANNALLLHRHGNTRHYFNAAAVDTAADTIELNCTPEFANGDLVEFNADTATSSSIEGPAAPAIGASYYAKIVTGSTIELYTNANLTTGKLLFDTAAGRFWVRRVDVLPGFFGNGAANLILQPTETLNAFDNGWRAVPVNVEVTSADDVADTVTAPNHRLQPGDAVALVVGTVNGWSGTKYARPLNAHVFELYGTVDQALGLSATTGRVDITAGSVLPSSPATTLAKASASKIPLPALRESVYWKGCLWGINQRDNIIKSDPLDFLHATLYTSTVPANLGESGQANWLLPLGEDVLLVGRNQSILALYVPDAGDTGTWRLSELTREYGGIAPLAALNVGADVQFLSRKGWVSVIRTVAGEKLGQARTLSESIPQDLAQIDWVNAGQSVAAFWDNRLLISVPGKEQDEDVLENNVTLAHNQLNQTLSVQQAQAGDEVVGGVIETGGVREAWEGTWTGDWLKPSAFAVITVAGEERLTFATPDGLVCYFDDDWQDVGDAGIETTLTTRGYFGGKTVLCLKGSLNWDAFDPLVNVTLNRAGYAETTALMADKEYANTDWVTFNGSGNDFSAPGRAGYQMNPDAGLYTEGVPFDVHQNLTEPLWMRERDKSPQLTLTNTRGSLRVNSINIVARSTGALATTQV